jgi:twitching motility two-component system response regulator PilG
MTTEKACILIADDEPNICRVAKLIISPDDYTIITANNGQDAQEKIFQHKPQVIFCDILMPKCDGFELCKLIKSNQETQHIPFIFLTGLEEKQFKSRMVDVKADDYLSKPFSSNDILEKLHFWLKKPTIHSESSIISIQKPPPTFDSVFQFGCPTLDSKLPNGIDAETFICFSGPIGSGKSTLARQFIIDGISKQQHNLLLSFETPNRNNDPIFNLNESMQPFIQYHNASRWCGIESAPWRNIDYIFDFLSNICAKKSIDRLVIDSFSHGFHFWSMLDILKFVDLCRSLTNARNMCVLFTINQHPVTSAIEYHLDQVMDIGIEVSKKNEVFYQNVKYSKWQGIKQKKLLTNV